jgi:hypothetical protein
MRLLVAVIVVVAACSPVPVPHVPPVQSDAGRQCVQTCQGLYNQCMAGYSSAAPVVPAMPSMLAVRT